jgi:hypothetical protein
MGSTCWRCRVVNARQIGSKCPNMSAKQGPNVLICMPNRTVLPRLGRDVYLPAKEFFCLSVCRQGATQRAFSGPGTPSTRADSRPLAFAPAAPFHRWRLHPPRRFRHAAPIPRQTGTLGPQLGAPGAPIHASGRAQALDAPPVVRVRGLGAGGVDVVLEANWTADGSGLLVAAPGDGPGRPFVAGPHLVEVSVNGQQFSGAADDALAVRLSIFPACPPAVCLSVRPFGRLSCCLVVRLSVCLSVCFPPFVH